MSAANQQQSSSASGMTAASFELNDLQDVQGLSEVFRCFICMENVRDARLCPFCSKFCCFMCIRRWIVEQRPHCPHCRHSLRVNDLVRCNWADDVINRIESMQAARGVAGSAIGSGGRSPASHNRHATNEAGADDSDICVAHNEKLSVFCASCNITICHHCALWDNQHGGHKMTPLKDEYNSRVRCVTEEIDKIRRHLCQLIATLQELESNMESIRQCKEERVREVRCAVELMVARLDSQMKSKLVSLTGQKRALSMEVEMIESVLADVEHQLRSNSQSRLLNTVPGLMRSLTNIQRTPGVQALPVAADFVSEIVPPYEQQVFIIHPYTEMRNYAQPIYSPPLNVNGLTWRLKVYANGNGAVRGNYLSVFIELSQGPSESMSYDYRVTLVHQTSGDSARNVVREFSNEFDVGECWGYNRFYKIQALQTEGFVDPDSDTLVLEFHVRSPNYYQKCRELMWYTQQLVASNQDKNKQITDLRTQLLDENAAKTCNSARVVHMTYADLHAQTQQSDDGLSSEIDEISSSMAHLGRHVGRQVALANEMAMPLTSSGSGVGTSTNQHAAADSTVDKDVDHELRARPQTVAGLLDRVPQREHLLEQHTISGRRSEPDMNTQRQSSGDDWGDGEPRSPSSTIDRIRQAFRMGDEENSALSAASSPAVVLVGGEINPIVSISDAPTTGNVASGGGGGGATRTHQCDDALRCCGGNVGLANSLLASGALRSRHTSAGGLRRPSPDPNATVSSTASDRLSSSYIVTTRSHE